MDSHNHMHHSGDQHSKEQKHQGHVHHDHHAMMVQDFRKRFWIALLLTLPVLLLSPMIQSFISVNWTFNGQLYLLFVLSTVIFFYGGWPFLTGLISEIKQKNPGMMTLIAVAISTAWFYSSSVVFGLSGKIFFWELD